MAQDDYYYEIQLSNKQLVFYFMAGATGLILSFLAGVMVGRGVDATAGDVQAARAVPVQEEKVVAEEAPARPAPPPAAEDLTYAQRLEGDKQDEGLEKSKPAAASAGKTVAAAKPAGAGKPTGVSKPAATSTTAPNPAPKTDSVKPAAAPAATAGAASSAPANPKPASTAPAKPAAAVPAPAAKTPAPKTPAAGAGAFTIQVGAFKDRASADSVVSRLKGKGFAAYVVNPAAAEGLFNVRVGTYGNRTDAEHVQVRLRDEEKFKPFIVKN